MPFGVVNCPVTFQGYINSVLHRYLDLYCIVYLDNIFIYSEDLKTNVIHVRKIQKRLLKQGLFVKLEKYVFEV